MYGPMHWLDDRHVTALLAPYICEGWDTGDYARFADLSGEEARRLRTLLPPLARDDRQNNAPRISDLLRAATRIDGLTLEGYVIRAPRWDERVSIDTVCVPESAIIAHTGRPIDDASCPAYEHWLTLAQGPRAGSRRRPSRRDAIPRARRIIHTLVVGMVGLINYPWSYDPTRVQLDLPTLHFAF